MALTSIEYRTVYKNILEILKHPTLIGSYVFHGRAGLLERVLEISIEEARLNYENSDFDVLPNKKSTLIGRIGAVQEFLYYLTRKVKPKTVIETGVYRGVSTSFILAALNDNEYGKLYSIDFPQNRYFTEDGNLDYSPLYKNEYPGFAVPTYLRKRWKLIIGDSQIELPILLEKLDCVDLFYHDSQHTYDFMKWEYNTIYSKLSKFGFLTSDDISWNSAFDDFTSTYGLKVLAKIEGKLGIAQRVV